MKESLAKLLRPAWKPALHWQKSAIAVDSWRVGFHPDRLSVGFARGSQERTGNLEARLIV
jgi:hypothetical protein